METQVKPIEEMVKALPLDAQQEVRDFVEFLYQKRARRPRGRLRLAWKGALADMGKQYTSVELQHQISQWWGD